MREDVIILFVEDDAGHRQLISKNLHRSGINNQIKPFDNGEELMDFFAAGPKKPQSYVLILDIRLPKMDGIEVLKRIRTQKNLNSIPVIMLTTTDDPKEVKKCYELGCCCYITKPVEYQELKQTISSIANFLKIIEVPQLT